MHHVFGMEMPETFSNFNQLIEMVSKVVGVRQGTTYQRNPIHSGKFLDMLQDVSPGIPRSQKSLEARRPMFGYHPQVYDGTGGNIRMSVCRVVCRNML